MNIRYPNVELYTGCTELFSQLFTRANASHSISKKTFKAVVGAYPEVISIIWVKYRLEENGFDPLVLLWMCSWFHLYMKNDIAMASMWGVCDRTFFPKVWSLIHFLYEEIDEVFMF